MRVSDEQLRLLETMTLPQTMTRDIVFDLQDCRLALEKANRALRWVGANWPDGTEARWPDEHMTAVRAAREEG